MRDPGQIHNRESHKRLAQLRSVSHALVSTLLKHQSKTAKVTRFGSLNFRDNCGWPCTAAAVLMWVIWLICSNRSLHHQKTTFLLPLHYTTTFCRRLSDHLYCTNRQFTYAFNKHMTTAVDFNLFSTTPPLRNFPCLKPT